MSYLDTMSKFGTISQRYPLLSSDEEHTMCIKYAETKSVKTLDLLVKHNIRLVLSIVNKFPHDEDLIAEGMLGLTQGIRKFDPYRGVRLSTYVTPWIKAFIYKFVVSNHRLVKFTTHAQKTIFFNLNKTKARLQALGQEISTENLAKELQVQESDIVSMEQRLHSDMRLDSPVDEESTTTRLDMLTSDGLSPDEALEKLEEFSKLQKGMNEFRNSLSSSEKKVFDFRLNYDGDKLPTLQEIGDVIGCSREWIRQIQDKLVPKLRKFLINHHSDLIQNSRVEVAG